MRIEAIRRSIGIALVATLGSVVLAEPTGGSTVGSCDYDLHLDVSTPDACRGGVFENGDTECWIVLGDAHDGAWDTDRSDDGMYAPRKGIYDKTEWAVVFHYESVHIPAGKIVRFENHPNNPPVVWLVSGDVLIEGTVELSGKGGGASGRAEPGPGGFRGGLAETAFSRGSGGFGPGASAYDNNFTLKARFADGTGNAERPAYSNERLLPIIGGSGGGADNNNGTKSGAGGGAGGGAILIASDMSLTIGESGVIDARGGRRGSNADDGSGGGIRILGTDVQVLGQLNVEDGDDGNTGRGRIRIEAGASLDVDSGGLLGEHTQHLQAADPELGWPTIFLDPADPETRTVRIAQVGNVVLTDSDDDDPMGKFSYAEADIQIAPVEPEVFSIPIHICTRNVDLDWTVNLLATPTDGAGLLTEPADPGVGQAPCVGPEVHWTVDLPASDGFSSIQVHAVPPRTTP